MPGKSDQEPTVKANNQKLTAVDKFTYLWSTLSRSVHIHDESLRPVWPSEDVARQFGNAEE